MPWTHRFQYRPRIYNALHLLRLASPVSQTLPEERARLCSYAAGARTAVEIGTFMGVTACELAATLPTGGRLYCIDPYLGGKPIRDIALRHLRRNRVNDRIEMLYMTSSQALSRLPSQVDFCFVDGDHSYEGLLEDWKVVKSILRIGGVAAFHDTAIFPGATCISPAAIQCFEEVICIDPEFELVETCMRLSIIRRKEPVP